MPYGILAWTVFLMWGGQVAAERRWEQKKKPPDDVPYVLPDPPGWKAVVRRERERGIETNA
jgi:hypothetical protein